MRLGRRMKCRDPKKSCQLSPRRRSSSSPVGRLRTEKPHIVEARMRRNRDKRRQFESFWEIVTQWTHQKELCERCCARGSTGHGLALFVLRPYGPSGFSEWGYKH